MSLLGDPQQAYPVIHITGTNGKGSTTRLMESLLQAMGLRVGTYTSPHLESVVERIRLGGEPISADALGEAIGTVLTAIEASGREPMTWFETVTAAALLEFANEAVDVAIVEVGMLGRYDATNLYPHRWLSSPTSGSTTPQEKGSGVEPSLRKGRHHRACVHPGARRTR